MNTLIWNNMTWILGSMFVLSCLLSMIAVTGTMPGSRLPTRVWEWFMSAWVFFGYLVMLGCSIWLLASAVNFLANVLGGWL